MGISDRKIKGGALDPVYVVDLTDEAVSKINAGSSVSTDVELIKRARLYPGTIRYVSTTGNDANDGLSPDTPFLTIAAAISASSAGDAISLKTGTYTDNNLDLNLDGLELWGETGAHIEPSGASTCLVVSGFHCKVRDVHLKKVGQIGLQVTGAGCEFYNMHCTSTVAYDVDGNDALFVKCTAHAPTVSGFDISGNINRLYECSVIGDGSSARGFYLSAATADRNLLDRCDSIGNATAGFEVVSGTTFNTFAFCTSGGGDGDLVDDGIFNNWPGFIEQTDTEHHESIYPISSGEGAAGDVVTVNNTTTDGAGGTREDQNYWGDVVRIIPPDTITGRWLSVGIYIHGTTTSDIQQWQIMFTYENIVSAQNGGNDWDENETALTVADGSLFEDGDFVWVSGTDRPNGEIVKVSGAPAGNVVTIARETTADGEAGLRYNYDITPAANKMYLVYRPDVDIYSRFDGDYSAASARDHSRYTWHDARQLGANAGMLMRMLNATDGLASAFDVRAIYEG